MSQDGRNVFTQNDTPADQALARASNAEVSHRWRLILILFAALCICFIDRGNLGVAAPVLTSDLHLSSWQLGLLLSGFYWTYSVCQIGSGWVVDRFDVRWIYVAIFCIWCVATFGMSLADSFAALLSMRLLLGLGESAAYPVNSRILAASFSEKHRGLANAVVDLGARIGPAIGTFFGGMVLAGIGWRGLFLVTGATALLWLIPWLLYGPRSPRPVAAGSHKKSVGWKQLLSQRAVWGTIGGLCGANYAWYFILSWLPTYLVKGRHMSLHAMAIWGSVPYIVIAASAVISAHTADRLISRGRSPIAVRKRFLAFGLTGTAVCLPFVLVSNIGWAMAGLLIGCVLFGVYVSNLFALTQSLAGPGAAASWTGLQNACGNFSGILSAIITGWLVSQAGSFKLPFFAASIACLVGASFFYWLIKDRTVPLTV